MIPPLNKIEIIHEEIITDPEDEDHHGEILLITELVDKKVIGEYQIEVYNWLYIFGMTQNRYWFLINLKTECLLIDRIITPLEPP